MSERLEKQSKKASWSYAELWNKFPIPARPDSEEILIEEEELKKYGPDAQVMILGSTIEYRSLCNKLGVKPYVVDFSRANFDSLTAYSQEAFEHETFVQSDWLEIEYEEIFDVILGHRPFNVIRHDQVQTLFHRMYRALKPGGVFFCRGNVRYKNDTDQLDELIRSWGKTKKRPYRLFSYLEVPLYMHCADSEGYLDYPKARETIASYKKQGYISDKDFKDIQPLISMPVGTKFRSYVTQEELEKSMRDAGFTNIEWRTTSHTFTKNMPVILLRK